MRSILRTALRYRGAILFAALQAAPPVVRDEASGRFSLALGIGADSYNQYRGSCDGPIAERRLKSHTTSGTMTVPLPGAWSVDGFVGETRSDSTPCAAGDCTELPPAFVGGFGGVRLRVDGEQGAFAFGVAAMPATSEAANSSELRLTRTLVPSLMFRLGHAEPGRHHLRAELNFVPAPGTVPMNSLGFVLSTSARNPMRAFLGVAKPPYSLVDHGSTFFRGELSIPFGQDLAIHAGMITGEHMYSSSAGLRLRFGGRAPQP